MPDIIKAAFTGPKRPAESPDRLVRYLTRRRELVKDRGGVESYRYRQISEVYGDPQAFRDAARQRAEGRNERGKKFRSVYTHTIISPERGWEFEPEDFQKMIPEWTTGKKGEPVPWMAVVHYDGNRPHIHVATVRDKFIATELMRKVEVTREICAERERVHGIDREEEREIERRREAEIIREHGEAELGRHHEEELNKRLRRDRERGLEPEL